MKICQQLILSATLVNRIVGTSDDIPARNDPKAEGAIAKAKALGLLIPGIRGKIPKDDTGKASEGVKENKVFDKDAPTLQQAHLRSDGGSEGRAGVGDCWSHDVGEKCWRDCDCKSKSCRMDYVFWSTCVECQDHQPDCHDDKYCDNFAAGNTFTCLPKKDGGATCTMMEQCKSNLCHRMGYYGNINKLGQCGYHGQGLLR